MSIGSTADLCYLNATELVHMLKQREISAENLMSAHLAQIKRVNPKLNAIVVLLNEEHLMEEARRADQLWSKGTWLGPLHGLPITHKDMTPTKGIRTTFGSLLYKDNIPEFNGLIVDRTNSAGAIMIGKTNSPEFAAGSHTFNKVFGATANPWDLSKSCGGSSGGAAVSLSAGMNSLSCGGDMGGSLRNPAAWTNTVGFRPSSGRVPTAPAILPWMSATVEGPMARSVKDIALLMSVIAGPTDQTANSITESATIFAKPLERNFKGAKVAIFDKLFSHLLDPEIAKIVRNQAQILKELGCQVEVAEPEFLSETMDVFRCERSLIYGATLIDLLHDEAKFASLKPEVREELQLMQSLNPEYIIKMQRKKGQIFVKMQEFMQQYDFFIIPTTVIHPFAIELDWPRVINGHILSNYIEWMQIAWCITVTEHPAISVPCGFSQTGMPVGMQIVGRWHDDFGVLQLAHAYEALTGYNKKRPPL